MNSLLASAGGAVLCLHDHDFGHILMSQHSEDGDDCHGNYAESHLESTHTNESNQELLSYREPHCVDIVLTATDEPVRHLSEIVSAKKPIAVASFTYAQITVDRETSAAPEMRLAARAPPASNTTLEQCVRKTVLRI